ncbi:MAG TPA: GAF domain-containing protein [Woeseiaceae bacterium]|nr:GAF domain-containing protein [Woeseiaceae bacterium]
MNNVDFNLLDQQLRALLDDQSDALADTANFVALLYQALDDVNWLGVYVLRGKDLVLGPFQGLPACVRIPLGKGVCGDAAARRETLRVADVHAYPGHIACDPASRSEIVVPLLVRSELLGLLDIDSPSLDRFSQRDQDGLELLCRSFSELLARHDGFI